MSPYNEADTRAKLIDPKIKLSGWGEGLIEREHYFVKGQTVTSGRIYLVGDESRRRQPRRVDYLLRYHGQMIAVLEAKDETKAIDAGLEQAKSYAKMLDVPFAYSSNGHGFVEFDFFSNQSRELSSLIICASPYNLKDVLEIVDNIDFKNPDDIHTVSHIYEDLLKRLGSENKMAGEFYTPRSIIRFMVEV